MESDSQQGLVSDYRDGRLLFLIFFYCFCFCQLGKKADQDKCSGYTNDLNAMPHIIMAENIYYNTESESLIL